MLPYSVAAAALVCLLVVSFLLWLELKERFPKIPPGTYLGVLSEIFPDEPQVPFFLERGASEADFLLLVLHSGWETQMVSALDGKNSDWVSPVTVSSDEGTLRFVGGENGDASGYEGSVQDIRSGAQGTWELRPVRLGGFRREDVADLKIWLSLRADLLDVETKLNTTTGALKDQESEIDKLSRFITEGEGLKKNAQQKIEKEKEKLVRLSASLERGLSEVSALKQQYELALKLTPQGKLFMLSRETLEREGRWLEAMFKTSALPELAPGDEPLVQRGLEVTKLQEDIQRERVMLERLRNPKEIPQ